MDPLLVHSIKTTAGDRKRERKKQANIITVNVISSCQYITTKDSSSP